MWTPDEAEVEGCALCTDGTDATDGTDGTDATDGTDGTDGTGGAAELKLSGTVFFLMSAVAALLLVA